MQDGRQFPAASGQPCLAYVPIQHSCCVNACQSAACCASMQTLQDNVCAQTKDRGSLLRGLGACYLQAVTLHSAGIAFNSGSATHLPEPAVLVGATDNATQASMARAACQVVPGGLCSAKSCLGPSPSWRPFSRWQTPEAKPFLRSVFCIVAVQDNDLGYHSKSPLQSSSATLLLSLKSCKVFCVSVCDPDHDNGLDMGSKCQGLLLLKLLLKSHAEDS